jgi:excinuclease ABC subunit C
MDIKEKVKNLPASPGVYLMKDSNGTIIYVGKSKNLKSRVSSYFINSKTRSPKVEKLVKNLKDFEFITTDTEFEAFMLECKLIKEIKPAYNRIMKNPLSYSYIKINTEEEYPTIDVISNCNKSHGVLCFGPYPNSNTVERAVCGIKEVCRILCSSPSNKTSSCLNYSIGLCIGACLGESKDEYRTIINKVINLLSDTDRSILEEMEVKMTTASEKLDFELAVKYRDYIEAVKSLLGKKKIIEFASENRNIALVEYLNNESIKLFLIKGNKVLFAEKYDYNVQSLDNLKTAIKATIEAYFEKAAPFNSIEVGKNEIDEAHIIYSYLQSKTNNCKHIIIPPQWFISNEDNELTKAIDTLL